MPDCTTQACVSVWKWSVVNEEEGTSSSSSSSSFPAAVRSDQVAQGYDELISRDLWELKQWKMEDIEQVDLLNLTFTQHMKDNGVAHFQTMACLSCLQPAAFIQHSDMWLLVNDKNKKYTVCAVDIKRRYTQSDCAVLCKHLLYNLHR